MSKSSILLVLGLILISCGKKNEIPPGILKPGKMQLVLWDVILADAYTTEYVKANTTASTAEENAKLQLQVFAIHGISKDDFYKSYDFYRSHTSLMKSILDSVIAMSNKAKLNNLKPNPNLAQ